MSHNNNGKQLSKAVEAVGHAIAGGIGGMAAITLFYPLSSVSTRFVSAYYSEKHHTSSK